LFGFAGQLSVLQEGTLKCPLQWAKVFPHRYCQEDPQKGFPWENLHARLNGKQHYGSFEFKNIFFLNPILNQNEMGN